MIGIQPSEVRKMSLWQFQACVDGYNQAHDPKAEGRLTPEEEEALARELGI